jgi:CcmD family protein
MRTIYQVLIVNLLIWGGIFVFCLRLDSRLRRLEKQ